MKTFVCVSAALATIGAAPLSLDPDTAAWWRTTVQLSDDSMEGRDTGSAAYLRAAKLVAEKFAAAGLQPAGENGGWYQTVAMAETEVTRASLRIGARQLQFLHDFTVTPSAALPEKIDARLHYGGYCAPGALAGASGRIVLCHGTRKAGLPNADQREAAVRAAGAIGIMTISDPGFLVEPPRWPFAYARSLRLADKAPAGDPLPAITLNAEALGTIVAGSGRSAKALIEAGSAGKPLPSFAVRDSLVAEFTVRQRDLSSPNILAILPGSDPALADQAIILSAHLDGYGYGEPVNGDRLYNGTLDNAAYVALLIRLAERLAGKPQRRPILFAAWTGEEKGLLGSRWFVERPTLPLQRIAATINLDQLRPIFPLELLTVHALDDSSLGDDVRAIAASMGIAVQADPEPERNLLRRTDHWPFVEAGIPATSFVFGYAPGSPSERIYRQWYKTGYHKPQDDPEQPMDFKAAADFNLFFYRLVERVANQPSPPRWKPGSGLKPR